MTPYQTCPNGKVYLAGPINGLSYDGCTEWREDAQRELARHGIAGMSPMRGKDYLRGETRIQHTYEDTLMSGQRQIFDRDFHDCTTCDVLLVNLAGAEKVSIGTMFELAWAKQKQTPVVLILPENDPWHDHPFVREAASFRVPDLDTALRVVVRILLPGWVPALKPVKDWDAVEL